MYFQMNFIKIFIHLDQLVKKRRQKVRTTDIRNFFSLKGMKYLCPYQILEKTTIRPICHIITSCQKKFEDVFSDLL